MPRKKNPARDRLDMRIEPELTKKAVERARQLGLSISSYVRMLISLDLERIAKEQREQRPK